MGIWCENDVVLTSMRRDYVASTLIRRHFGTKCPLGMIVSISRNRLTVCVIHCGILTVVYYTSIWSIFLKHGKPPYRDIRESQYNMSFLKCGNALESLHSMVLFGVPVIVSIPHCSTSNVEYKQWYIHFSPIGQEYPFLQVSEIFLFRPAISA